jgi:hypothetical protein
LTSTLVLIELSREDLSMTSDEHQPYPGPEFGPETPVQTPVAAPEPAARKWSGKRTAAALAITVGVAAAGGVAVAAATNGATSTDGTQLAGNSAPGGNGQGGVPGQAPQSDAPQDQVPQGDAPQGQAPQGGPGATGRGGAMALGNALHGEFVVPDGNGGYATRLVQTGTVSAIDSSSITVASEDGYTKKYSIGSSSTVQQGLAAGAAVTVVADQGGSVLTVSGRMAGGRPDRQNDRPPQQQPTT